MYDINGKLIDRREMLKIKLKSLAEEARIIRKEERKTNGSLRCELSLHRRGIVREVSRNTHIAYGLIRGLKIEQIENPKEGNAPDKAAINKMLTKYGPSNIALLA